MNRLPLGRAAAGTATLHEACKSAYTGIDRDGPRQVLRKLPGVTLKEMKHHGRETACCGSGADCWFAECGTRMRDSRLQEAARTGAERLVTVCHYCHQVLAAEEARHDFNVTNYVTLVAEALGIRREDKFKKYSLWGNPERILRDAEAHIAQSPFAKQRIIEVLQAAFGGRDSAFQEKRDEQP
jgi:Fe-S oxidoreductase